MMQPALPARAVIFYSALALFSSTHTLASDFDFGFELSLTKDFPTLPGNCGISDPFGVFPGLCGLGNGIETPDPDTTPFYQGQALVDGKLYWHVIVGDPDTGFAMESYTEMESTRTGGFGSFSGGIPTNNGGLNFNVGWFSGNTSLQSLEAISGNGWDPLGIDPARGVDFTGNGSGDPTRTVIRQVMGDGTWNAQTRTWDCEQAEYCSEFLKGSLTSKPVISQTINASDSGVLAQMRFKIDMSNLSYFNDATAGTITNSLTLTDLGPPDDNFDIGVGNFDMATDIQAGYSNVTGGRYLYEDCPDKDPFEGSCWQAFDTSGTGVNDYQEGSYTYIDGGAYPMAYEWGAFLDLVQNELAGSAGAGNEAKCGSAAAPGSC